MIPANVNPTELELVGDVIADHQLRQLRFGHEGRAALLHEMIEERGGAVQLGGGIRIVVAPEPAPPAPVSGREPQRLVRAAWGR